MLPTPKDDITNNNQIKGPIINHSILVIDDDADDSNFITDAINEISSSYETTCMDKGDKAVAYLNSLSSPSLPSLIILDYNMPIYTGLDVLKAVKTNTHTQHIPVAIYTHSRFPRHMQECLEAGAVTYLGKSSHINGL